MYKAGVLQLFTHLSFVVVNVLVQKLNSKLADITLNGTNFDFNFWLGLKQSCQTTCEYQWYTLDILPVFSLKHGTVAPHHAMPSLH